MSEHLSFSELINQSIEMPLHIDGELWSFFSTQNFSLKEYNNIFFKLYPDEEYPILISDNQFELDDKGEPLRDYTDKKINKYNQKQALYRFAAQLKMVDCNIEEIQNCKSIDEIVIFLKDLPNTAYEELEKTLKDIIEKRFTYLQPQREYSARLALANTKAEKNQFDLHKKEAKEKRDKLFDERDKLLANNPYLNTSKLDKEIAECEKILNIGNDGIQTDYGITETYLILSLQEKYHWTVPFTIKILKNELTTEEEIYVLLCKQRHNLDCESEKRISDKYDKKNNSSK